MFFMFNKNLDLTISLHLDLDPSSHRTVFVKTFSKVNTRPGRAECCSAPHDYTLIGIRGIQSVQEKPDRKGYILESWTIHPKLYAAMRIKALFSTYLYLI